MLKFAENESTIWAEAQVVHIERVEQSFEVLSLPSIPGRLYFTDDSWKNKEFFSGQSWYSTLEGFDGLMGKRNDRASLSLLHLEVKALLLQ